MSKPRDIAVVVSRGIADRCRETLLTLGGAAGPVVKWLAGSVGVDGEFADEASVDEDVAADAGRDDRCVVAVVFGADGDAVAARPDDAVVDVVAVHGGRLPEWLVGGSAVRGVVFHTSWGVRRPRLRWGRCSL